MSFYYDEIYALSCSCNASLVAPLLRVFGWGDDIHTVFQLRHGRIFDTLDVFHRWQYLCEAKCSKKWKRMSYEFRMFTRRVIDEWQWCVVGQLCGTGRDQARAVDWETRELELYSSISIYSIIAQWLKLSRAQEQSMALTGLVFFDV